nr:PKD domain protein [uncultured bacterium]
MFRGQPYQIGVCLLLLVFGCFAYARTEAAQDDKRAPPAQAPTVALDASSSTVSVCPRDSNRADARVQLVARATDPQGEPLRYAWSASGGRIEGDGANTNWDLTGTQPGVYTAQVEVSRGRERDCMAFTSISVRVTECPAPICPNISIYCPGAITLGQPINFSAKLSGGDTSITPVYNWKISAGTITSGQGTPSIMVDTTGLAGQSVTATLEMGGYSNLNCTATCSSQIPVRVVNRKFDEYGNISRDDEKARLDNFAIQLQQEPDSQGYIIVYAGRRTRPGDAQKRLDRARDYLTSLRGIDARRLVTLEGGTREDLTVELWIVPTGAAPPPVGP